MSRYEVFQRIRESGLIGIIREKSQAAGKQRMELLIQGGVEVLEVSLCTPGALDLIAAYADRRNAFVVGAGTVLDAESARLAILAGAQFVIAPNFSSDMAKACNRYAVPLFPGVGTVNEIITALEWGCDIVKLFPASSLGPGYIKAVRAPIPQVYCIPVGGVNIYNIEQWFESGAFAVAMSSELTHIYGAEDADQNSVLEHIKNVVKTVKSAQTVIE